MAQTDFVLMLHSHLPYVLNHGRWPHGSDWLCEAALDTYLPLLEQLQALEARGVAAPVTLGFTPVLAAMLAHPTFWQELDDYLAQRLDACASAPAAFTATDDEVLLPVVRWWESRLRRLRTLRDSIDGNLIAAFRGLQDRGRLEITSSAATHGFLPLLGRDESIRLQLLLGRAEHRAHFGRDPEGCWVPECAYRGAGEWHPYPHAVNTGFRRGLESHLADTGYRYFFADSHMARAGEPLGVYGARFGLPPDLRKPAGNGELRQHTPHVAYRVTGIDDARQVAAFVRDPRSSEQVWNRYGGYPGDGVYLEFHKIRWPEGLRLWRVTSREHDLGDKAVYVPDEAVARTRTHAAHFAALLGELHDVRPRHEGSVIVAPFDTELLGHWWFEGPEFLGALYSALPEQHGIRAATAAQHLDQHGTPAALPLVDGSWGKDGDYSMWMSDEVAFTWPVIWELENRFWNTARQALAVPSLHGVLAQAARSLLLLQSSDWQFIITTGAVADYATARFEGHAADCTELLGILADGLAGHDVGRGVARAAELHARDDLFRDILPSIEQALRVSVS